MNIKLNLLAKGLCDYINQELNLQEVDANIVADTVAIKMLSEIQKVLKNNKLDDFEIVEEIVDIFHKNRVDSGGCHDF